MSYTAEVTEVTNTTTRNAFYRTYVLSDEEAEDYRVVFQWGARGSKGQSQNRVFAHKHEAERAAHNKLLAKMDRGYVRSYHRELPAVADDILELAGVNLTAAHKAAPPSADPFVRISLDVDRARRLAMGDAAEVTEAVIIRKGLMDQLAELRTSVSKAEGEVEIVEMLLTAKVG